MKDNEYIKWSTTSTSTSSGSNVKITFSTRMRNHFHDGGIWGILDAIGHKVNLPQKIMNPVCDRYDLAVGMTKKELIGNGKVPWWLKF